MFTIFVPTLLDLLLLLMLMLMLMLLLAVKCGGVLDATLALLLM
jgi:hypothetical protein